jgi:hypothetical protein
MGQLGEAVLLSVVLVDVVVAHDRDRGKGAAVRAGSGHATGDIVVIQDADLGSGRHGRRGAGTKLDNRPGRRAWWTTPGGATFSSSENQRHIEPRR